MSVSASTASSSSHVPFTLSSRSEQQTHHIGAQLGALCQPNDLILLEGTLGAGKTALTQGIGAGLGVYGVINSPTFTFVKEHTGRLPLYHFDLYRLDDPAQVDSLGIDDYLERAGVCVVEWAERALEVWPPSWLRVRLRISGPHTRRLLFDGIGSRGQALLAALAEATQSPAGTSGTGTDLEEMA